MLCVCCKVDFPTEINLEGHVRQVCPDCLKKAETYHKLHNALRGVVAVLREIRQQIASDVPRENLFYLIDSCLQIQAPERFGIGQSEEQKENDV